MPPRSPPLPGPALVTKKPTSDCWACPTLAPSDDSMTAARIEKPTFVLISPTFDGLAAQLGDDPERRPPGLHALDVVEAVAVRLGPVVPRRPGAVRGERDIRKREERMVLGRRLLDHDVEARSGDRARLERLMERVLVDDGAAARVDEDRGLLHHRELARRDHLPGDVVQRHVQRDDVGSAEELGEEGEADAERVLLVLGEPEDVEVAHVHVEALDAPGDHLADVAEADDAQALALDLVGANGGEVAAAPLAGD